LAKEGKNPLIFDSKEPTLPLTDYIYGENRFNILRTKNPERAALLLEKLQKNVTDRFAYYQKLAAM
jgi:pyruvate-ferredoxin/flavodoxin oxidoreductase